ILSPTAKPTPLPRADRCDCFVAKRTLAGATRRTPCSRPAARGVIDARKRSGYACFAGPAQSGRTWRQSVPMKRVAVFGNAGGGKSTLARRLAELTRLPLYPLDMIQFRAGGGKVPHD